MNRICRFLVLIFTAGLIFNPTSVFAAKIRHTLTHWSPITPEKLGELSVIAMAPTPQTLLAQQSPDLVDRLLADGRIPVTPY